jgi:putative multiple sugar transport system substrate-binding protein
LKNVIKYCYIPYAKIYIGILESGDIPAPESYIFLFLREELHMKRKLLSLILTAAMTTALVAGCGSTTDSGSDAGTDSGDTGSTADAGTSDDSGDTGSTADAGGKIGISMPTQSLERWNRDGQYLDEQFKAAGYETVLTYSDNDSGKQVNDIQNMLADGVDLLVVAAIDGEALNTAMNEAAEQNVPVISYDRLILNDAVSYYVSFDNYTVGTLQGQFIVDTLDLDNATGSYNMEITAGDPADNNAGYFYQGAIDTLQPYIDSGVLNVVSGQTDFTSVATDQWNTDTALERAQNVLSSYYADGTQLDVWLCSNDSTALGVAQAITSDYAGSNSVLITGQDGDEANLKNIVDGIQTMTVYKNVSNESIVTLALAKAIINGDTIDESLIPSFGIDCAFDTESYETSDGNKCPSFLLVPSVITKDNLQELVDTGLYTMDSDGYLKAN